MTDKTEGINLDTTSIDTDIEEYKRFMNSLIMDLALLQGVGDIALFMKDLAQKYNIEFLDYMEFYDALLKLKEKKEGDIYYYDVDNPEYMSKNLDDILFYIDCTEYNGLMEIGELQEVKRQFWVEIESHKQTANERKCFDTRQEAEEFLKKDA